MKKSFGCGHKGKGQYCHRCALADSLAKQARELTKVALASKGKMDTKDVLEQTIALETRANELRKVPKKNNDFVAPTAPVSA